MSDPYRTPSDPPPELDTDALIPFERHFECPKCGACDTNISHLCTGRKFLWFVICPERREHFHRSCEGCGWTGDMAPKDKTAEPNALAKALARARDNANEARKYREMYLAVSRPKT